MPPVDSADVLCHASVDTLCVIVSSTVAVRHQAQSSKSAPATPTALPNVPHHESLSCARADHDWIRLAPGAGSPTSFRHLPGLHTSVSSIVPSAPQTGFQYWAVDSITASSTCCSTSHSESSCSCSGLLPYHRRSNWYSSVDFDVSHNYGQLLLMYIDSRYPIWHRLPPGGSGERAADFIKQGLGLSPLPQGERPRTIYSLYHARSGSHTLTASASPLSNQSRRSSHCGVLPGSGRFSSGFAGRRPHITLFGRREDISTQNI